MVYRRRWRRRMRLCIYVCDGSFISQQKPILLFLHPSRLWNIALSRMKKPRFSPIYSDESLLMFVVAVLAVGFAFVWISLNVKMCYYYADRPPKTNSLGEIVFFFAALLLYCVQFQCTRVLLNQTQSPVYALIKQQLLLCSERKCWMKRKKNWQTISRKQVMWLGWLYVNMLQPTTIHTSHECAHERARTRHTGAECVWVCVCIWCCASWNLG